MGRSSETMFWISNLKRFIKLSWMVRESPRPRCTCKAPIGMIGTMLVATSVGQTSKSTGTRSGRYRPNRSKTFVNRLKTAKREKEDLKIKSVDSSTAYNRTYIVENIRKKSNHKVEIRKSLFCDCEDFTKNSEKEFWKHIIWTLRYLIFVDCPKTVICCSSYASVNSSC